MVTQRGWGERSVGGTGVEEGTFQAEAPLRSGWRAGLSPRGEGITSGLAFL